MKKTFLLVVVTLTIVIGFSTSISAQSPKTTTVTVTPIRPTPAPQEIQTVKSLPSCPKEVLRIRSSSSWVWAVGILHGDICRIEVFNTKAKARKAAGIESKPKPDLDFEKTMRRVACLLSPDLCKPIVITNPAR